MLVCSQPARRLPLVAGRDGHSFLGRGSDRPPRGFGRSCSCVWALWTHRPSTSYGSFPPPPSRLEVCASSPRGGVVRYRRGPSPSRGGRVFPGVARGPAQAAPSFSSGPKAALQRRSGGGIGSVSGGGGAPVASSTVAHCLRPSMESGLRLWGHAGSRRGPGIDVILRRGLRRSSPMRSLSNDRFSREFSPRLGVCSRNRPMLATPTRHSNRHRILGRVPSTENKTQPGQSGHYLDGTRRASRT